MLLNNWVKGFLAASCVESLWLHPMANAQEERFFLFFSMIPKRTKIPLGQALFQGNIIKL